MNNFIHKVRERERERDRERATNVCWMCFQFIMSSSSSLDHILERNSGGQPDKHALRSYLTIYDSSVN